MKIKSFSRRILFIVLGSFVITNAYYVYNVYSGEIETAERSTLRRLEGISRTIATQFNGTIYKMLLERYSQKDEIHTKFEDPFYRELAEILERAAETNDLHTDIYTLTLDSIEDKFYFGISSGENQYYRHEYSTPPELLRKHYNEGGVIPAYRDEHGTWLSSFSPIKDHKKQVVGVVQVDMPFDKFIMEARAELIINILYSLLLILVVSGLMFYWLRKLLSNEEKMVIQLEDTNELIAQKNKDITASISYARRIQRSLMDSKDELGSYFKNSFIYYKPKDIVSGDYYWIQTLNKSSSKIAIAVADCTGHGVPGALVSVLGITFLRDIVNSSENMMPNKILSELNFRIIETFKQKDKEFSTKDGMDISLCLIDFEQRSICFSGAYRPMIIIRNNELIEIAGDKKPIGGTHFKEDREFTLHEEFYQSGDWIYMFSDGYVDQFGGEKKRKYMKKRFKEKLLEINPLSGSEQLDVIRGEMNAWKGDLEQIDDITVMGIQLI
ncbi:MAG: SpoIIE family protein phosphatase [Vicingaceae bacterium]